MQQPQGQYRQPPQRGGPSVVDKLQQPKPMGYLKGIVGSFAIGGLLLGGLAVVLGSLGGFSIVPQAVKTAQQLAGAAGESGTTAAAGPAQLLSQGLSTTHAALLTYIPNLIAPFIALTLAIVFAVVIATQMAEPKGTKLATAAVSTGVGAFVFILGSTLILGLLAPSIPQSLLTETGLAGSASVFGGGVGGLGTLQFGNLILNSVIIAVLSGLTAAGIVYAADSLLPQEVSA